MKRHVGCDGKNAWHGVVGWIANQCRQYNRKLHSALVHYAAGLGSGALVSAVALVLVPHGPEHYSPVGFAVLFGTGSISVYGAWPVDYGSQWHTRSIAGDASGFHSRIDCYRTNIFDLNCWKLWELLKSWLTLEKEAFPCFPEPSPYKLDTSAAVFKPAGCSPVWKLCNLLNINA